jgi:addiction module RelB/DinJ family antitoxin
MSRRTEPTTETPRPGPLREFTPTRFRIRSARRVQFPQRGPFQIRVTSAVKYASEQIFHRIGLSMTEAVELFLRRAILEEKLPFEVVALNEARLEQIAEDYERQLEGMKSSPKREKGGVGQTKNSKSFLGDRTLSRIRPKNVGKKARE